MSGEDMNEVIQWLDDVDMATLDLKDALMIMGSVGVFVEAVKPIMIKDKCRQGETFIMKL